MQLEPDGWDDAVVDDEAEVSEAIVTLLELQGYFAWAPWRMARRPSSCCRNTNPVWCSWTWSCRC